VVVVVAVVVVELMATGVVVLQPEEPTTVFWLQVFHRQGLGKI